MPTPAPEPVAPVPTVAPAAPTPPPDVAVESEGEGLVVIAQKRWEKPKVLERDRAKRSAAPVPAVVAEPVAAAAEPAPAPVETVRVVAQTTGSTANSGDRFHTVLPGESLWSIASDVLGDRASVAGIAREVNRLWELNDDRIGTGRPDLVYAGTRLRLR